MKRIVVKNVGDCVACLRCMTACAKAYYKTEDVHYAALHVRSQQGGVVTIDLCTQCGKCAQVCPVEAIAKNAQGVYTINRKTCVGCLACMDICPQDVIRKSYDNAFATKCTSCGLCVKACPADILAIETT